VTTLATPGLGVTARLELLLADRAAAERARDALAPESGGFLGMEVLGDRLVLLVEEGSVGRVLKTVDDAVQCLQAALGAVDQTE
jgi:hypothetical protein